MSRKKSYIYAPGCMEQRKTGRLCYRSHVCTTRRYMQRRAAIGSYDRTCTPAAVIEQHCNTCTTPDRSGSRIHILECPKCSAKLKDDRSCLQDLHSQIVCSAGGSKCVCRMLGYATVELCLPWGCIIWPDRSSPPAGARPSKQH